MVGVDSSVATGESVVVDLFSVEVLSDCVADPITMTAPRIQTQIGNLRNFFLNHFGLSATELGDEGGEGMLPISRPFKHA